MPQRYVFEPPAPPSLPIAGSDQLFPIHRIYCVGRNYAAHAREMGHDEREPPFFLEAADTLVANHETIPFPSRTNDLHHEIDVLVPTIA